MRRIAEQEAAAVAEPRRASVVDAVSREPGTGLEIEFGACFLAQGWNDHLEINRVLVAQFLRQNSHDAPMILAAHGKQQMKSLAPEVDIDLLGSHVAGHFHVGHEEHVFVRGARKRDAVQLAHGAARAIASGNPGHAQGLVRSVSQLERCGDTARALLKAHKLGVPAHFHTKLAEFLPHDLFIVILAKNEDVGIGRCVLSSFGEGHPAHLSPLGPKDRARGAFAQFQGTVNDAKLGIDFQGAGLHAQGPGLQRRTRMAVDDLHTDIAPDKLIGEHQPRRPGADDQYICLKISHFGPDI
jgi:hypothetical protein